MLSVRVAEKWKPEITMTENELTDWLTEYLACLAYLLTDWLTDSLTHSLSYWFTSDSVEHCVIEHIIKTNLCLDLGTFSL